MKWPMVKLKDCCEVIGGATPRRDEPKYWDSADIPWITPKDISNLNNKILDDAPEYISQLGFDKSATFMLPKGSVLLTSRAPIGNLAITGIPMCTNQGFKSLVPGNDVDCTYLYYCMLARSQNLQALGNGATFKEVSKKVVEEFEIPLPPLEEQKRIAAILDKADAIRQKRQQAIALADDFLRSIFLDMFGDPVTNSKGWKKCFLGDVIEFAKDGPHVSPMYSDDGIPFLSTRNISFNKVVWEDLKYISEDEANIHWKKCKPTYGDLLYTKGGTTGIACPVEFHKEFAVWVHVALLRPLHSKVNFIWLAHMLNSTCCYSQSQMLTRGATNKDLGLKRMVGIEILCPPLSVQERFVNIRSNIFHKLEKADLFNNLKLFESLSKNAFSGQL